MQEYELVVEVQQLREKVAVTKSAGEETLLNLSKELEQILSELNKQEHAKNDVQTKFLRNFSLFS